MILVFATAVAQTCPAPTTAGDVARLSGEGEIAFKALDSVALQAAAAEARGAVRCLAEAITPAEVAAFYRVQGYAAFVHKDRSATLGWFLAARRVQPSWSFPESLVSANHPMRGLYESIPAGAAAASRALPEVDGVLVVDGVGSTTIPDDRTSLLQLVRTDGRIGGSWLVVPGADLPELPGRAEVPVVDDERRPSVAATAGLVYYPLADVAQVLGDLEGIVVVPIIGPVDLDAGLLVAGTPVDAGAVVVPGARIGLRGDVGVPYVGGVGLLTLHAHGPEGGAALVGGAQVPIGDVFVAVDGLAGWCGAPFVRLGAGIGIPIGG